MKTTMLPEYPDAKSPAGADIRFIMDGETGNMIHSTVPPHQVNKATVHGRRELHHCSRSRHLNRYSGRNSVSVPKRIRRRLEVHLHRHAALAGRLRGYLCQGEMAANDLMLSDIRCR